MLQPMQEPIRRVVEEAIGRRGTWLCSPDSCYPKLESHMNMAAMISLC